MERCRLPEREGSQCKGRRSVSFSSSSLQERERARVSFFLSGRGRGQGVRRKEEDRRRRIRIRKRRGGVNSKGAASGGAGGALLARRRGGALQRCERGNEKCKKKKKKKLLSRVPQHKKTHQKKSSADLFDSLSFSTNLVPEPAALPLAAMGDSDGAGARKRSRSPDAGADYGVSFGNNCNGNGGGKGGDGGGIDVVENSSIVCVCTRYQARFRGRGLHWEHRTDEEGCRHDARNGSQRDRQALDRALVFFFSRSFVRRRSFSTSSACSPLLSLSFSLSKNHLSPPPS